MGWLVWVIVGVGLVVAAVAGQRLGVMNFRPSRDWRRSAGNVLGPVDEVFAPNRHEAMLEQERQTELPAPAPSPDDPPIDLEKGVARIDLGEDRRS